MTTRGRPISESKVEKDCRGFVVTAGGLYIKLTSTYSGNNGIPDRLILGPNGYHAFIELKKPGEEPSRLQHHWIKTLNDMGHRAGWTDNLKDFRRMNFKGLR